MERSMASDDAKAAPSFTPPPPDETVSRNRPFSAVKFFFDRAPEAKTVATALNEPAGWW
jgi:hypothetical protein